MKQTSMIVQVIQTIHPDTYIYTEKVSNISYAKHKNLPSQGVRSWEQVPMWLLPHLLPLAGRL